MRFPLRLNSVWRASAWIVIQALLFTQILPAYAFADQKSPASRATLRAEQKQESDPRQIRGSLVPTGQPHAVGLEEKKPNSHVSPATAADMDVGLSIGATKIGIGVLPSAGVQSSRDIKRWRHTWGGLSARYPSLQRQEPRWAASAIAKQLGENLREAHIDPKRVAKVWIIWGGLVSAQGHVQNIKIPGFSGFVDFSGELRPWLSQQGFDQGVAIGVTPEDIATVIGEKVFLEGALHGQTDGIVVTMGTGDSAGILKDGKPLTGDLRGEIGWSLMRQPEGSYIWRPPSSGKLPTPGSGEIRFEQRFGGPWLAARFVREVLARGFGPRRVNGLGKRFQDIEIELSPDTIGGQEWLPDEAAQLAVIQTITEWALGAEDETAGLANDFLRETGREFGQGLKAFLAHPDNRHEKFVRGRVVLSGSIGELLGLGVAGDPFLTQLRSNSGADVVRSQMSFEREFAALRPAVGLEEMPTAPTRIQRVSEKGVQVAHRGSGRVIGTGRWEPTAADLGPDRFTPGPKSPLIERATELWVVPGLAFLQEHRQAPAVQRVSSLLTDGMPPLSVQFVEDHASLFDWRPAQTNAGNVLVDVTVAQELDAPQFSQGRSILAALLLHHMLARSAGYNQRQAYHFTIAFYGSLADGERKALREVLKSRWIDHGDTFRIFLERAVNSKDAGIDLADPLVKERDTPTLEEAARSETDGDRFDQLVRTAHYRDRMVSWLLHQIPIDPPYNVEALEKAATDPKLTLDQQRAASYAVVRDYDVETERENARRVSADFRNALPLGSPARYVVDGRLSRAFSNQGLLFSDSAWVPRTQVLVEAVQRLDGQISGQFLLEEVDRLLAETKAVSMRRPLKQLRDLIAVRLGRLQPAMGRLRLLAKGPEPFASKRQYSGAIRQLREVTEIFQTETTRAISKERSGLLEQAREGSSRVADARDVQAINQLFNRVDEYLGRFVVSGSVPHAIGELEGALSQTETIAAAFSVQLQRPSLTGSRNLYEANHLIPKPEQEESLKKLVRLGGHNTYASADYEWVAHATDVIEAAPLSIYERLVEVDGEYVTVFEVDQQALEETIRQMADYWARNIEATMESEHVALAREIVVLGRAGLRQRAQDIRRRYGHFSEEDVYLAAIREQGGEIQREVALVAAWLGRQFDNRAVVEKVERFVEGQWRKKNFVDRVEALRSVVVLRGQFGPDRLDEACVACRQRAVRHPDKLQTQADQLVPQVIQRRRELPAFHMLTTEAPGLVEGFIQVILEEEMALRNVILGERARVLKEKEVDLVTEVEAKEKGYRERLAAIAERVVEEFGYAVVVDSVERSDPKMTRARALQKVVGDNLTFQEEAARIAVMAEVAQAEAAARGQTFQFDPAHPDHPLVESLLTGVPRLAYEAKALPRVWERNQLDSDLQERVAALEREGLSKQEAIARAIQESQVLSQELAATMRRLARADAFEQLTKIHPDWELNDGLSSWYRNHTNLSRTTARKAVIAEQGLNDKRVDPRYDYGSGAVLQKEDGKFEVTGRRKRYHLIYANSRVNLGKGERDSVEVWPQWIGVTDPLAARRSLRVYGLINYTPVVRTIKEVENLKISENERTALRRAIANTQAFFNESLGFGDTEDLSFQFNQRGGLPVAAVHEGETFQAGPITGYCITKDPWFKKFRDALGDTLKLTQIGIPKVLHPAFIQMVRELGAQESEFQSGEDFEKWMAEHLLSKENLEKRFSSAEAAGTVQKALKQYIDVRGGVFVLHLGTLRELLANVGVPSLLVNHGQDLGRFLWSSWASDLVTVGGQRVNRATIFQITLDIFWLIEEARRLNPGVSIAAIQESLIHLFGPYKGDPDHPSPPDVRESAAALVMMDLSDLGHLVAHALDEEGQRIWRANRYGLRIDSDDPEDQKVTRTLAGKFLGVTEAEVRKSDWYRRAWEALKQTAGDADRFHREEERLLTQGFVQIVRGMKAGGDFRVPALEKEFPGHPTVGNIAVTVVPGVSTDDFLTAKVDAKTAMSETADQVQTLLTSRTGMTPAQMAANAQADGGTPLDRWVPLVDEELAGSIGGKIHPLAFRLRGPGSNFGQDIQNQDLLVFMTVHPDLLALEPSQIRDRMMQGRPQSALAVRDGSVQGRHRVWLDRKTQLWYAAGRGVDGKGEIILDWARRDTEGRKSVYRAFGMGDKSWKPLLGTDLREEEIRQEHRAARLYGALEKIAQADAIHLPEAIDAASAIYAEELPQDQMLVEANMAGEYQQMAQIKGMDEPRDEVIRRKLEDLATEGFGLSNFSPTHWLAVGGMFLLHGAPQEQQQQVMRTLRLAHEKLTQAAAPVQAAGGGSTPLTTGLEEIPPEAALLLTPRTPVTEIQRAEVSGEMFSVKVSETQKTRAVALMSQLRDEAIRQKPLSMREKGFRAVAVAADEPERLPSVDDEYQAAQRLFRQVLEGVRDGADADSIHEKMGQVIGHAVNAMRKLNNELMTNDAKTAKKYDEQITALTKGREIHPRADRTFIGSYEDPGMIPRWFEEAGDSRREEVAKITELFHTILAIHHTAEFIAVPSEKLEEERFWRELSTFFSHTIDDHFYEYNPWVFDPKRGNGFQNFYDKLGVVKPERAQELYALSWNHHRLLYDYLRELMVTKTPLRNRSVSDQNRILGKVKIGHDPSQDHLQVQAIGAGAPTPIERKWRAYTQLREIAFMRNAGFQLPPVFVNLDPDDPEILGAPHRINFTFLGPVGRDHYAWAHGEAVALGDNLFWTRHGTVAPYRGSQNRVLQITDGHVWMSQDRYRNALMKNQGLSLAQADQQIVEDWATGRMTPKGIRVALTTSEPIVVGSVVPFHHHPLSSSLTQAGYPYTDKSEVMYEITYNKSLNPEVYNPAYRTATRLPPEVDWLRSETAAAPDQETALERIAQRIRPLAQTYGTIIAKGAAESGSRNWRRLDLWEGIGPTGGLVSEAGLRQAAEFIYQVSKGQNVTIQRGVITTPFAWMDAKAIQEFRRRQIEDWGVPVHLKRHPKSWVYGSLRMVTVADMPAGLTLDEKGLFNPDNWRIAHRLFLNNLQAATNLGRQGTLEILEEESVRPEFRQGSHTGFHFIHEMEQAVKRSMVAMARFGKKYWDEEYAPAYRREYHEDPVEFDATGVPYWWPRYLMMDLIPEPIWGRNGQEVPEARVLDVIAGDPEQGTQSRFILQGSDGKSFEGEILGFTFWVLEPNTGIGQWPNVWRREKVLEFRRAEAAKEPVNWDNIGKADRVVLNAYLTVGEAFLKARLGAQYFGRDGRPVRKPEHPGVPPPPAAAAAPQPVTVDPFSSALTLVRGKGIPTIGPAQVSSILVEAALIDLGGLDALRSEDPTQVLAWARDWLAQSQRADSFPQGLGISVTREDVRRWLEDSSYRDRVAELVVDRVLSEPLVPPIEIFPEPATAELLASLLPHSATFAVVTGKRALMNHHLYPWVVGQGAEPVNVVAVDPAWITSGAQANRVVVMNPKTGWFVECDCSRAPVRLSRAFVVELPQTNEVDRHLGLSDLLEAAGISLINPGQRSAVRADDKMWLRENHPEGVSVPRSHVIPQGTADGDIPQIVREFARSSPAGVVIQPRSGTTQGEGVERFSAGDLSRQRTHVRNLIRRGDAILSEARGNVTYEGRPVVFRFNLLRGQVVSASAVVGPEGGGIASLGRGGKTIPLGRVLRGLRGPEGQPLEVSEADWTRLERAAQLAAQGIDLEIVGIDLLPEVAGQNLGGVVVEGNARPGTLLFGERLIFDPDNTEEPIRSRAAAAPISLFAQPLSGLEERMPKPSYEELERWVDGLKQYSAATQRLYGWVADLPADERREVLSTVAQAYERFGDHMRWVGTTLPQRRSRAVFRRKGDGSWISDVDELVQTTFNDLVRAHFPRIHVIGEEASVAVAATPWRVLRDPIDGTSAYRREPRTRHHSHYTSPLTLLYKEHPVLTMSVAPEYENMTGEVPRLVEVAGIGMDGVLINDQKVTGPSGAPLKEIVAGVGHLEESGAVNTWYEPIVKRLAAGVVEYDGSMALFEIPLSIVMRHLPGTSVTGPMKLWDTIPAMHLIQAMGGAVLTLDGRPFELTENLLAQGDTGYAPPLLFSRSLPAAQEILAEYRSLAAPAPSPESQEAYLERVSGGEAVRWRPMWSPEQPENRYDSRSYDAFVRDYFPSQLVPELASGIRPLLDRIERESAEQGKRARIVDGAGGLGVGLQQIRGSGHYPHLDLVLNDMVEWDEEAIPQAVRDWLRQRAPGWGIRYEEIFSREGLTFRKGDLSTLALEPSQASPVRLIMVFGALSFFDDPLGTLVRLYNRLPQGGILLALLNVPMEDSQKDQLAREMANFYESVVVPDLQSHGIEVDFKKTDRRMEPAPVQGMKPGSPEFQLAFVFRRTPQAARLLLTPEVHTVHGTTTRPIEAKVVRYVGEDLTKPFQYFPSKPSGLEELRTLEEWQRILANAQANGFKEFLKPRYEHPTIPAQRLEEILADRLNAYRTLIAGAIQAGFDPKEKVAVVASVGRDRTEGGHQDSPGEGHQSANAATEEEILAVAQKTNDGKLYLANFEEKYPPVSGLPVSDVKAVADAFTKLESQKIWSPVQWDSYIRGALAYLLSPVFHQSHPQTGDRIQGSLNGPGMRFYVGSIGELALPASGGVSSSSALTGAFSMALNAVFDLRMTLEEQAEVDFSEYLLDKRAGAADKTAQLYARRGEFVVVGSIPETFLRTAKLPTGLAILMAEGPPRLTTLDNPDGLERLEKVEGFAPDEARRVVDWAKLTMRRFGSPAFTTALRRLRENLKVDRLRYAAGIKDTEAQAIEWALMRESKGHPHGLLRELVAGGAIEQELPELAGWENRYRRYNLVYRLLRLIPEHEQVGGLDLALRKAALYGLSEGERISTYLRELDAAVEAEQRGDEPAKRRHIARILDLVRWSQDGDRATVDYRHGFAPTEWVSDPRNQVTDQVLDQWINELPQGPPASDEWHEHELFSKSGGFERSTPDFDELATQADKEFNRKVALRVAAAGMRGTFAVHVDTSDGTVSVEDVIAWFRKLGWAVRVVRPGPPTQLITPPSTIAGLEDLIPRAAQELQKAAAGMGLAELGVQWRGITSEGLYTDHDPVLVSAVWNPTERVDSAKAAETLRGLLASSASLPPHLQVSFGPRYITVGFPDKVSAMRDELRTDSSLAGKRLAIIVGDSPSVDFVTQDQAPTFPIPFVQVLVQGENATVAAEYPFVATARKAGDGVDQLLGPLSLAIVDGRRYENIELLASRVPPEWRKRRVNPEEIVIFLDIDGTTMGPLDTFDEFQSGVGGQEFQRYRLQTIATLASRGVDFRFTSGKAAQEVSGKRIFSDEKRLLEPLIAEEAALPIEGGSNMGLSRIGYLGVSGIQRGHLAPNGKLVWERVALPTQPQNLTDAQAVELIGLMRQAIQSNLRPSGMEEGRGIVEMILGQRQISAPQGAGMALPAQQAAQAIVGMLEHSAYYNYEQRKEAWDHVAQELSAPLADPVEAAWLTEVFTRMEPMVHDRPAQEAIHQALASLEQKEPLAQRIARVPVANRVVAVEWGGTMGRSGLVDSRTGELLIELDDAPIQFPNQPKNNPANLDSILTQMNQKVQAVLDQGALQISDVGSISVSMVGDIDEPNGIVSLQNNGPLTGVNVKEFLKGRWGRPVAVSNDTTAAVRAEAQYGGGQGRGLVAYLTVSTGTNAGYRTSAGKAVDLGLWGWSSYDGKTVDEHTSGTSLARIARESRDEPGWGTIVAMAGGDPEAMEGVHVGRAFERGNPLARKIVEDAARVLGRAIVQGTERIASAGDLSDDPENLWILGGGVAQGIGEPFRELIQQAVDQELVGSTVQRPIRVVLSQMKASQRGLQGAAVRAREASGLEEAAVTRTLSGAPGATFTARGSAAVTETSSTGTPAAQGGAPLSVRPSDLTLNVVHIFEPQTAAAGLVIARIQRDPVVLIAADWKQEEWLMRRGFGGQDRIILNAENLGSVDAARAAAQGLFERRGFYVRYYPASVMNQLNVWMAWVLEHYQVQGVSVNRALDMVEEEEHARLAAA